MLKNKLPIIIYSDESKIEPVGSIAEYLKDYKNFCVINTNHKRGLEIETSWNNTMKDLGLKSNHGIFIHMLPTAFETAKMTSEEQKLDFSIFHFYYDIYKPKLKQENIEYFCWSTIERIDTLKKVLEYENSKPLAKISKEKGFPKTACLSHKFYELIGEENFYTQIEENELVEFIDDC